jgi:1,5-anhydro-D-fructose reductase (1,5-anhydro-D-mannitol-forming)
MATIKWGLIGSSGWADHTFGPAIARTRGQSLVAVLGSTLAGAEACAARHGAPGAYAELAEFLAHPGLDVVWIASPPDLHKAQGVAALRAGKHVLCEKPMAVRPADCRALVKAARAADRRLGIGFNNRAHPVLQRLARLSASGRLGDALEAHVQVYYPYPSAPPAWRQHKQRSGGWAIGDLGTHLLDVLCWLMQATPRAAQGHLSNRCFGLRNDDHACVQVLFANGAVGSISACTGAAGGDARVAYHGTRGYFSLRGGLFGAAGELEIGMHGKSATREPVAAFDTYGEQVRLFAAGVKGRSTTLAGGEDGVTNISLVSAARGW